MVGMPVTLGFNSVDYDLFIASYTPGQAAVPGAGGSAVKVQASAAPTTYDFSTSSSTFTITWQGVTYTVSLVANYVSMSGLLAAITEDLTGSGLVAQDNGGTVLITEADSPFAGGAITSSSLPASVFGDAPVYTSGTASTGGSPAVTANVTLAYNSATGTAFSGMPEGVQRLSLAHRGNEYRIVSADGTTATVARLVNGAVDESWLGFTARTMIDYEATGLNDTLSWLGPFLVCPENETVDMFEVNFSFPNGAYNLNTNSAVHAICWAQGETDNDQSTPTSFATYRTYLQQLQVSAEADIKAVNGQTSPVHFLTYQTSYKIRTSTGVALAQLDLATNNEKFHFVSPCYHLPFYTDGTHLTNVGYKWLGAYFGRAYKTLVHDQCFPQFLRPVSAILRGKVLTLTLDPPVSPVVIDTTNLAVAKDYGFMVKGRTTGSAIPISAIETAGNQVRLTLTEIPTEAVTIRYALDYLGTGLNIVNGASGNLRDSEPAVINIQGVDRPLFNVCPHFELNVIKVGE